MPNSDGDSDFSVYSDSDSSGYPSPPCRSTRSKRVSLSSAGNGCDSKRQKTSVITIDDSDDDALVASSASFSEYEFDSLSEDESLLNRLQKRDEVPAGLKTTGLGDDSYEDSRNCDNAALDKGKIKGGKKSIDSNGSLRQSISLSNASDDSLEMKHKKESWKPQPATAEDCKAFIEVLEKNVNKRKFSLSQIPKHQIISTGRTIKQLKAWKGLWPPLREFLQNTVDHLNLMDGKTGRRRQCLTLKAYKSGNSSEIQFICQDQKVCTFLVSADQVIIEQQYTYPIASRSLDTGVVDTTKTSDSNQAGGFGDGFKTAAVALLSNSKGKDFESLNWFFYALEEKTKVSWSFEGLTKESIATFAKCEVLQVIINKSNLSKKDISMLQGGKGQKYVMRQVIKVKNIGKALLEQVIPMFSVFWDLDEGSLISTQGKNTRGLGGDFLGPAISQPSIFQGALGNIKPKAGVYVRGIWIRNSKIKDTIMSFFGNRLEVTGRDRNEIDDDELMRALIYVLHRCNNVEHLRVLLQPLRENSTSKKSNSSWLLKSPAFFNRVIDHERDFIRHDILRIARGSIFVSGKTTKSKDPFFKWASTFLQSYKTPVFFIEKGANKHLFEEENEFDLREKCVKIIKGNMRGKSKKKGNSHSVFTKFLEFLGVRRAKVIFSTDVGIAFAHGPDIFIPECPLSRDLIIRVLNVCHSHLEGVVPERYSSLLESLLKNLERRGVCSIENATDVVRKAKKIEREASDFLHHAKVHEVNGASERGTLKGSEGNVNVLNGLISRRSSKNNDIGNVGGGAFEEDNAGKDKCLRPSSQLSQVKLNGQDMLVDDTTADHIRRKTFDQKKQKQIALLRESLEEACSIILKTIPALCQLLDTVQIGYDGRNDSYEAYYDGTRIVINFFAFLSKLNSSARSLIFDIVIVVTHELAHALLPNGGHGPGWRACHMNMINQVMIFLED